MPGRGNHDAVQFHAYIFTMAPLSRNKRITKQVKNHKAQTNAQIFSMSNTIYKPNVAIFSASRKPNAKVKTDNMMDGIFCDASCFVMRDKRLTACCPAAYPNRNDWFML